MLADKKTLIQLRLICNQSSKTCHYEVVNLKLLNIVEKVLINLLQVNPEVFILGRITIGVTRRKLLTEDCPIINTSIR
ncbi:MAG: hypothetical protein A4E52_01991 [Pelotomaculum sp. PtaB.Bin013]|nr:MAG: hypothetical protein A4E52_01991 [Pelotomaculum sp. PtaB.Bin013]